MWLVGEEAVLYRSMSFCLFWEGVGGVIFSVY